MLVIHCYSSRCYVTKQTPAGDVNNDANQNYPIRALSPSLSEIVRDRVREECNLWKYAFVENSGRITTIEIRSTHLPCHVSSIDPPCTQYHFDNFRVTCKTSNQLLPTCRITFESIFHLEIKLSDFVFSMGRFFVIFFFFYISSLWLNIE